MHLVKTTSPRFAMPESMPHQPAGSDPLSRQTKHKQDPQPVDVAKKLRYGHTMADVEKQILDWQEEMKQDSKILRQLRQKPVSGFEE